MNITRSLTAMMLAAAFATPLAAAAQTSPAPPPSAPASAPRAPHHHGKMMLALQSVNLTADQRAKIRGFMADAKAANAANPAAKKANRQQMRANIEGVLTPAQLQQYRAAMSAPAVQPAPKS